MMGITISHSHGNNLHLSPLRPALGNPRFPAQCLLRADLLFEDRNDSFARLPVP